VAHVDQSVRRSHDPVRRRLRRSVSGVFDPALGGDPILFQHLFWFYSHPAVYIMVLPSMGVVSELVTAFSRKNVFGYHFVAFSSIAIAILGFLVWAHHMFVTDMSPYAKMIFSLLSFLVSTIRTWSYSVCTGILWILSGSFCCRCCTSSISRTARFCELPLNEDGKSCPHISSRRVPITRCTRFWSP
jgi:hypothetical protein